MILSVPQGQLQTKFPCHTTFFHWSGTFSICFCGSNDVSLDIHCGCAGFILTALEQNCETKVDAVLSTALIYQNLEIPSFCVLGSDVCFRQEWSKELQRFPSLKYNNAQKWGSRFSFDLGSAKNMHHIKKRMK